MTVQPAPGDLAVDAPAEMALIHRIMRTGFRRIEAWVADVPPEGTRRAAAVADHLENMLLALHGHHSTEDSVIWPLLRDRCPDVAVDAMTHEHAEIGAACDAVRSAAAPWRREPSRANADALRAELGEFRRILTDHLDEEERDVVPHIPRHVTRAEWARVGEEGFRALPPAYRFTAMGQMLEAASPAEAEQMMSGLPAPVRVAWRLVGRRRYESTMDALRGRRPSPLAGALMARGNRGAAHLHRRSEGRRLNSIKGLPILLLIVPGRRTGRPHTTPVVYVEHEGSFLVAGSAGGAPSEPQWFANLRAADSASVEIGPRRLDVDVRVPDREERDRLWDLILTRAPSFAGYQRKAQRLIPIAVLTPRAG